MGSGVLAVGGAVAFVRTSSYDLPRATLQSLRALAPWEYVVVQAAARRIAASDRPGDASVPTPDAVDVAGFVDGYVATMPPVLRWNETRANPAFRMISASASYWLLLVVVTPM